tara:strand:- start:214 stop:900 length:687 start_codon:yes stop_codon:yes gene_type:complete
MNILKTLRKPYFAMFLSTLILFVSCEQYSLSNTNDSFDYSVHNAFIKEYTATNTGSFVNKNGNSNTIKEEKVRLQNINTQYGTSIMFPDEFLGLTDYDPNYIENKALSEGWINQNDIYLMDEFETDLQLSDFETAIQNYESNVLSLNLNSKELTEKNLVANSLKSLNHYHPEVFTVTANGDFWGCVRAVVALVVSSVGLAACATIILCGVAVTAWILSYATYVDNCIK